MMYLYFIFLVVLSIIVGLSCFAASFAGGYYVSNRREASIEAAVCANLIFILGLLNWATTATL